MRSRTPKAAADLVLAGVLVLSGGTALGAPQDEGEEGAAPEEAAPGEETPAEAPVPPEAEPAPPAPEPAAAPAPTPAPDTEVEATTGAAAEPEAEVDVTTGADPDAEVDPFRFGSGDWWIRPFGYVRAGYENVQNDERYAFIGQNDGFVLDNVRLGVDAGYTEMLSVRLSVDGATATHDAPNTPIGTLEVRVRHAYGRFDPTRYAGIAFGQLQAPFAAEEMRDKRDLLFASRAVGQEGVLVGRGFEEPGITIDRQIGVMASPREPFFFGKVGLWYGLMLANGNGENQLVDDNGKPALIGRLEGHYAEHVTVGGAFLVNSRRVGAPPNQFDEDDTGFAADVLVRVAGLEVFGQFVQVATSFPTVGVEDRTRRALSAQLGYRFEPPYVHITPAYRFAQYHPWAGASDESLDAYRLDYHTAGVRLEHAELPLELHVNYTFTVEPEPRTLDNDRLQIMAQAGF